MAGFPGGKAARRARREEFADRLVHWIALALAALASIVLLVVAGAAERPALGLGVVLYVLGLGAMLVCSTLYNGARPSRRKDVLQRLDHAAIFLLIAGTYAPFLGSAMDDPRVAAVHIGVWTLALLGVAAKLLFPGRIERLSTALYLALGWSILLVIGPMIDRLPGAVMWLLAVGGVLYSAGVAFHIWERLPYQRAIWHGFVLAAAGTHYAAVLVFVQA